ncbi:MAG: flagellar hook-length control protein FliK [Elstera sp.]
MASTPVKTSQVDRLGLGFTGASVNADATKLKGRASPESVRHFESLLDATNRATPAEKPAAKPAARSSNRAEAPSKAPEKLEAAPAPSKPDPDKRAEALEEVDAVEAANIADTAPVAEDVTAPSAQPTVPSDEAVTPDAESDTQATAPDSEADAAPVAATPLPVLPLSVYLETQRVPQAALLAQAGAVQAVPTETDLSQQEPIPLPQTIIDDVLAAATAPVVEESLPAMQDGLAPQALPPGPSASTTPWPTSATPTNPAPAPQTAPVQTNAADAIIETLTVVAREGDTEADAPVAKPESGPAPQVVDTAPETQAQPVAAQTALVAPVVTDAQPKAKAAAPKPQADAVAPQDAETLAGLPTTDAAAAPATEAETKQDQNRQDQSPAERGRERAQERAQAGERLAARFADSQISLIRDEASLSGPIQAFKAGLKVAAAEASLAAATTAPQSDTIKAPNSVSATAAVVNNAATTGNAAPAAKTAARPNSPVFQTPVVQQVGTRLVETAANGGGRVIMDLRPEHLGRVTIDVDVREDGRLTANVLVDNPAALEQLRRDAGQLEQALRDTGLNPDQNSLNFALREQAQENGGFGREDRRGRDANGDLLADAEIEPNVTAPTQQSVVPGLGVIDIRI